MQRKFRTGFTGLAVTGILFSSGISVEGSPLRKAPLNPGFQRYVNEIRVGKARRAFTVDGYPLGLIPGPVDLSHVRRQGTVNESTALQAFSSYYDLRDQGRVTPVKDQGSCGSCWAFATYGSLESWLLGGSVPETRDFSENNLKNTHGFDWTHCEGGNRFISTAYLSRWSGPVDEGDDPYDPGSGYSPPDLPVQKHLETVIMLPDKDDDGIKQAVMDHGGVFTAMYYTSTAYRVTDYTYYYKGAPPASNNHAVTIVGWDDSKDTPAKKNGAWIVKNSWGPDWGDGGYFYVSYYDANIGTDNAYFIDAFEPVNSTNYQYDPLGWIGNCGYSVDTAWAANVFTAVGDEQLLAVGFYASTNNTSYEIYVYDNFDGDSFSGLLGSKSGSFDVPGYFTVGLDSPVLLTGGDDFGIVVRFSTPGYNYPIPYEYPEPGYSSGASSNPGESYVSSSGTTFADITTQGSGFEEANVCIKGIARSSGYSISGTVIFEYPGWSQSSVPLDYQVREPGLPPANPLYSDTLAIDIIPGNPASGGFTILDIADGTYDVALKHGSHVAGMVPGVVVSGAEVTGLEFTLWAGDADGDDNSGTAYPGDAEGDNDVDLGDYYTLFYQYHGGVPLTTGYNSDFNADGNIDLLDYYGLYYGYQNAANPGNWY